MYRGEFAFLHAYKGKKRASGVPYHCPLLLLRQCLSTHLTSCFSDRLEVSNPSNPPIPSCLGADTDICGHTACVVVLGYELILMNMQQVLLTLSSPLLLLYACIWHTYSNIHLYIDCQYSCKYIIPEGEVAGLNDWSMTRQTCGRKQAAKRNDSHL